MMVRKDRKRGHALCVRRARAFALTFFLYARPHALPGPRVRHAQGAGGHGQKNLERVSRTGIPCSARPPGKNSNASAPSSSQPSPTHTQTEIPLPDGVSPPHEDPDDLQDGAPEPPAEPRWGELGLEDLQ